MIQLNALRRLILGTIVCAALVSCGSAQNNSQKANNSSTNEKVMISSPLTATYTDASCLAYQVLGEILEASIVPTENGLAIPVSSITRNGANYTLSVQTTAGSQFAASYDRFAKNGNILGIVHMQSASVQVPQGGGTIDLTWSCGAFTACSTNNSCPTNPADVSIEFANRLNCPGGNCRLVLTGADVQYLLPGLQLPSTAPPTNDPDPGFSVGYKIEVNYATIPSADVFTKNFYCESTHGDLSVTPGECDVAHIPGVGLLLSSGGKNSGISIADELKTRKPSTRFDVCVTYYQRPSTVELPLLRTGTDFFWNPVSPSYLNRYADVFSYNFPTQGIGSWKTECFSGQSSLLTSYPDSWPSGIPSAKFPADGLFFGGWIEGLFGRPGDQYPGVPGIIIIGRISYRIEGPAMPERTAWVYNANGWQLRIPPGLLTGGDWVNGVWEFPIWTKIGHNVTIGHYNGYTPNVNDKFISFVNDWRDGGLLTGGFYNRYCLWADPKTRQYGVAITSPDLQKWFDCEKNHPDCLVLNDGGKRILPPPCP